MIGVPIRRRIFEWKNILQSNKMYESSMKFTKLIRARICKRLRGPGIDSEKSIQPNCLVWWAGTTNRVVVPARHAGNRFLGSLKGLQNRAQHGHVCVSADRSWKEGRGGLLSVCLFVTVGVHRYILRAYQSHSL
jgi:hypothetical protein